MHNVVNNKMKNFEVKGEDTTGKQFYLQEKKFYETQLRTFMSFRFRFI